MLTLFENKGVIIDVANLGFGVLKTTIGFVYKIIKTKKHNKLINNNSCRSLDIQIMEKRKDIYYLCKDAVRDVTSGCCSQTYIDDFKENIREREFLFQQDTNDLIDRLVSLLSKFEFLNNIIKQNEERRDVLRSYFEKDYKRKIFEDEDERKGKELSLYYKEKDRLRKEIDKIDILLHYSFKPYIDFSDYRLK